MVELGQIALILSFMIAGYSSVVGFAGGMLNGRILLQAPGGDFILYARYFYWPRLP